MEKALIIRHGDNVAVALTPLDAGEIITVENHEISLADAIPAGHKFALREIAEGENVVKYGAPIGMATKTIAAGNHVHLHNLRTRLSGELTYEYRPAVEKLPPTEPEMFQGYLRANGRAGARNEIWIIPTVACVNRAAEQIARRAQSLVGGAVEGVYAFPHPYGCSQMGDDLVNTRVILADLATHPNVGGALVMGLGCENSCVDEVRAHMGAFDESRVRFLVCQQVEDEIEAALALISELAARMRADYREPLPADKLVIGLKCGGSDGFSGITANPVIGGFSDILISQGGSAILTEVPEMFGAETLLMARCESREVYDKTVTLINDFKRYFIEHGQVVYENPAPGNKVGGISTLEDKSLGCTEKSGRAPVSDVLAYGETVKKRGLTLLNAPGNDAVSATALAAAGAQIVLFSTGRGTPFGCPVPTIKIATNTPMAQKKRNWIDFDAGELLAGRTLPELSRALFEMTLATASGKPCLNEINNYRDFAIFKQGVTV